MQSAGCPCCAYQQPLSGPSLFSRAAVHWEWATGASKRNVAVDSGSTRTLLLDGGTIVDPRDGSIAVNVSVRIRNGRIVEVSPREAAREDPGTERIDAAGRFIVPGYNDMHSHALNLADPSASLALMLAEGVTGFRQMSGSPALLKKRRDNTLPIGPAAPALLETPGTVLTPLNSGSSKAVVAEIRRQQDQGADFVKMVMAGPDVFMAAVEEAVAVGIPDPWSPARGRRHRGGFAGRLPVRRASGARLAAVDGVFHDRRRVALGGVRETGDQGAAHQDSLAGAHRHVADAESVGQPRRVLRSHRRRPDSARVGHLQRGQGRRRGGRTRQTRHLAGADVGSAAQHAVRRCAGI